MGFSYWEKEQFINDNDIVIIGGGIVGLSTAISLKEVRPNTNITVIEPFWPPQGASTKNAGFLCYGSLSEIISDLDYMSSEIVIKLIAMRYQGATLLKSRLNVEDVKITGGYELFHKNQFPSENQIKLGNEIFEAATKVGNYFKTRKNSAFSTFDNQHISLPQEGMLNPAVMISKLKTLCNSLGVKFLHGFSVTKISGEDKTITISNDEVIPYNNCIVCTNAFTRTLLPDLDIHPARNMVMMVTPKHKPRWEGVYHFDQGYYYFRNYGNKVLIGGARNQDLIGETTSAFGINQKIKEHLQAFLTKNVLESNDFIIEKEWSGIMGVSDSKLPLMEHLGNSLFIGARLGGMGIAIGSYMGKELADLVLKHSS